MDCEQYAATAEFYDYAVSYHTCQNVAFVVKAAQASGEPVLEEIEQLLARCGFEVEALYADYDKSPYGSRYPGELIFVARKG